MPKQIENKMKRWLGREVGSKVGFVMVSHIVSKSFLERYWAKHNFCSKIFVKHKKIENRKTYLRRCASKYMRRIEYRVKKIKT